MHHLRKQGLLHGVSLRFHPIPDGAFGRRLRHRNKRDRYGRLPSPYPPLTATGPFKGTNYYLFTHTNLQVLTTSIYFFS